MFKSVEGSGLSVWSVLSGKSPNPGGKSTPEDGRASTFGKGSVFEHTGEQYDASHGLNNPFSRLINPHVVVDGSKGLARH